MGEALREESARLWFRDHEALFQTYPGCPIETLRWRKKSGSSVYCVHYVLHKKHGTLMVYGDLGEAVYKWYCGDGETNWKFIADCNLDYFAGKCCASETGDKYVEWSPQAVREALWFQVKEYELKVSDTEEAVNAAESKEQWHEYVTDQIEFDDWSSDDWEWAGSAGVVTNLRCLAHLEGIKMAFVQWNNAVKAGAHG